MNISEWLEKTTTTLQNKGTTPRLDAEVFLCHVLGKDRAEILAHSDDDLEEASASKLKKLIARRKKNEPIAYILGKSEFYCREFFINKDVLVPRPESETMIDLLRDQGVEGVIVDVGTGSGALAVTAKLELPATEVFAIDIDPNCIKLAEKNAQNHDARIDFFTGNLLEPYLKLKTKNSPLIILANLPYVPNGYQINEAARHEPELAIFGGMDGLDLYRELFSQISHLKSKICFVFTESLPEQHQELESLAKKAGYKQISARDLIQVFVKT